MTLKLNTYNIFRAIGLLFSTMLSAQTLQERMEKDPMGGASIFSPYRNANRDGYDKTPGRGYRPFYISHFGRHGSRYYSQPKSWQSAVDCFSAFHKEGGLTVEGELAPLGAVEHREIARRMYDREKPVFKSKKRNQVRCISSVYSRCIVSMANFTEELSSLAPDLDVSYLVGKRFNNEYRNSPVSYDFNVDADLRFAHDSAFLPLCTLLGIPGYPICSIEESYRSWNAADAVPMCSNLQMVFYRKKDDVVVKVYVNEKETILNDLTPVSGLFYRWEDVKTMIERLESVKTDKKQFNHRLYE